MNITRLNLSPFRLARDAPLRLERITSSALLIVLLGVFLAEDFMLFLLKGIFGVTQF